jgi:hypothetical protein
MPAVPVLMRNRRLEGMMNDDSPLEGNPSVRFASNCAAFSTRRYVLILVRP